MVILKEHPGVLLVGVGGSLWCC